MMVFNPLFLQNTSGVENIHPEKVNKLNSSGYLFSDIINVFMNTEENESLAKLTQEFLGSAQIKENNGTPVILSMLGESFLPLTDLTKNLKLNIEDFIPANLKKNLVKVENENNKNVSEKSLTANQNQLAQILQTINNLFTSKNNAEKVNTENTNLDLTEAEKLLEESDGIFFIVETSDKVFNINISKQPQENLNTDTGKNKAGRENVYKIKFTLINENSFQNFQNNGALVFDGAQNNNPQLSFLPFESELASEKLNSSVVKLKVFTYQNTGTENTLVNPKKASNYTNVSEQTVQSSKDSPAAGKNISAESQLLNNANAAGEKEVKENLNAAIKENKKSSSENLNPKDSAKEKEIVSAVENKKINTKTAAPVKEQIGNVKALENLKESESKAANTAEVKTVKNLNAEENAKEFTGKNVTANNELKSEVAQKTVAKETFDAVSKKEFKESGEQKFENKKEEFPQVEKTVKEKVSEKNSVETNPKTFEKFAAELKENEQLNIKVAKAVKNITTVKHDNPQNQNVEKPVKENSEIKVNSTEDKNAVKPAESNDKNLAQNENSFKQSEENKHVPLDANRINSTQSKEKFTLDAPTPHSNSERIVKAAEIMKEISKFIEKQDKSTLTIRVSPEDLGKLKITLDIVEHSVKANIHVENEAVKTLVEKNIADLQNQMSKNGIQLTSVNVSLSESDQKNAKQFVNKKKSNNIEFNEQNVEESEDEKVKMMGYNTVEYLA